MLCERLCLPAIVETKAGVFASKLPGIFTSKPAKKAEKFVVSIYLTNNIFLMLVKTSPRFPEASIL